MTEDSVKQLEGTLGQLNRDYLMHKQESDQACDVHFLGPFNGHTVVWQAHIQTLESYADQMKQRVPHGQAIKLQQFIEIEQQNDDFVLNVGVNLDKIDEAAIKRTIIMIRKYKRLQLGRHEYGDFVEF